MECGFILHLCVGNEKMYIPFYAQSSRGFNFCVGSMRENKEHGFRAAKGAGKLKHTKSEFKNWVREN